MIDDRMQVTAAKADRVRESCTLVLFGASGDLAQRMVVPAIFRLAARSALAGVPLDRLRAQRDERLLARDGRYWYDATEQAAWKINLKEADSSRAKSAEC